jgi:transposase
MKESTMPRTHAPYPPEFRQQVVELVRAGRKPGELAREFGCSSQSIQSWVAEAALATGEPPSDPHEPLGHGERQELTRLRREVQQLKTERDILAKATAWFAGRNGKSTSS